jgi:hypothetical protein
MLESSGLAELCVKIEPDEMRLQEHPDRPAFF